MESIFMCHRKASGQIMVYAFLPRTWVIFPMKSCAHSCIQLADKAWLLEGAWGSFSCCCTMIIPGLILLGLSLWIELCLRDDIGQCLLLQMYPCKFFLVVEWKSMCSQQLIHLSSHRCLIDSQIGYCIVPPCRDPLYRDKGTLPLWGETYWAQPCWTDLAEDPVFPHSENKLLRKPATYTWLAPYSLYVTSLIYIMVFSW